jgi:hypothetical protein
LTITSTPARMGEVKDRGCLLPYEGHEIQRRRRLGSRAWNSHFHEVFRLPLLVAPRRPLRRSRRQHSYPKGSQYE